VSDGQGIKCEGRLPSASVIRSEYVRADEQQFAFVGVKVSPQNRLLRDKSFPPLQNVGDEVAPNSQASDEQRAPEERRFEE
jgi:hypothetical protein